MGPGGDHRARNKLLEHLITGDETWLHLSTPETKSDSMTWKHPSSPVTKKFKVQQSATKVMATVFWDSRGMILLDILLKRREDEKEEEEDKEEEEQEEEQEEEEEVQKEGGEEKEEED
ncbi:transposase [Plakobranchus ocellatus]|uniref:Transposase n=1 Tax=Plakobranchus ocellatus TaxID=259542 RepID=A0AAV4DRC1_9GAST|nr:transposase [Plakobranchus ocellatus]